MEALERVKEYLNSQPYNLKVIEFDMSTHTSELAAAALGVEVGQIAKSLLFMSNSGPFMVVTCGDRRVQQKKIKESLGCKPRFANSEEVSEVTGFNPGGVCPFALKTSIPVYLDASLRNYPVVYAAAGSSNTAVPITFEQLADITNGQECDFC